MPTSTSMHQLIEEGYVAPHPEIARARIKTLYSCQLDQSGRDCSGIALLRNLIQSLDSDLRYARSLFITAAHTHWGSRAIVISFDPVRNVFISGPAATSDKLKPLSFVFSVEGPVPYEWADESVQINSADLQELHEVISRLNDLLVASVSSLPIPLGITINHHFKGSLWDEQAFSFAEGPQDEENGRAIIRPVVESIVEARSRYPDQVQVAWSAFPNSEFRSLQLTEDEVRTCLKLEELLRKLAPNEAVVFLDDLQSQLQSKIKGG